MLLVAATIGQEPAGRRPGGANASFEVREFRGRNGQVLRYSLYVPTPKDSEKSAAKNVAAKLPLVLCLHGAGGNTAAANVLAGSEIQQKYPCVVMAPTCAGGDARWVEASFGRGRNARAVLPELLDALDSVIQEKSVDPDRVYLTGQSMGGVGTWGILAKHPGRFAAAVPVCGIWSPDDTAKMSGVAIWAFHGDMDPTVPVAGSRDMIAALKKAGVTPEPRYSELAGVGHASWSPAYATPELWEWLFAQRRQVATHR